MTAETLFMVLALFPALLVSWVLPRKWAMGGVAVLTFAAVAMLSPLSAAWMFGAALLTPSVMALGDKMRARGFITASWTAVLVAALFVSRRYSNILWIGGAYFTLRNLHVLFDWWMGKLENPGLVRSVQYQFFLPVIISGPIHRIQQFERQVQRRRWSPEEFATGAERALFGLAMYVVVAGKVLQDMSGPLQDISTAWSEFLRVWSQSALDWIQLYFSFAGLNAVAIGVSLMMGIKIEENFDRPWSATSLADFWTRWHMTLSLWCRDYVFQPVTTLTRIPLLGLAAGMLAIGLWHETSFYYVGWAIWQVLGIAATRMIPDSVTSIVPKTGPLRAVGGPLLVFGWLSLARPVLQSAMQVATR